MINGFITGKYPYVKRLNNGNYIIVSSSNITFTDQTLTKSLKNFNFKSEQYESINDTVSTTITQFPAEDNGFILVIVVNILYIFSSKGDYLNSVKTSIEYTKAPSFIMTNGHLNNTYYFTLIYSTQKEEEGNHTHWLLVKGITNTLVILILYQSIMIFQQIILILLIITNSNFYQN